MFRRLAIAVAAIALFGAGFGLAAGRGMGWELSAC
jgi:hypothetical protein